MGGSFDPIHFGHLQLARDARDRLELAEVRLIPAAQPWQKGPITDAAHRAEMVRLAIAGEPRLVLDLREIERGGASYTIDTLRELRARLGRDTPLALIMGGDQVERVDTWREWESLLDYAHLAVARRNNQLLVLGDTLQTWFNEHWAQAEALRDSAAGKVIEFEMTPVAASATTVRQLLQTAASSPRDEALARLVPAAVLDYIDRHRLYR